MNGRADFLAGAGAARSAALIPAAARTDANTPRFISATVPHGVQSDGTKHEKEDEDDRSILPETDHCARADGRAAAGGAGRREGQGDDAGLATRRDAGRGPEEARAARRHVRHEDALDDRPVETA